MTNAPTRRPTIVVKHEYGNVYKLLSTRYTWLELPEGSRMMGYDLDNREKNQGIRVIRI